MKAFAALAVAVAAGTALLTACSTVPSTTVVISPTASSPGAGSTASAGSSARPGPARVFGRIFDDPDATVTDGRLYVTWQVNSPATAVPQYELARVNQATGAIAATHLLGPGRVGAPLVAGGSLWVPVATATGESLFRLNPVSLAQTADLSVGGGSGASAGRGGHLAVAGGALWVAGGDRLLRVSLDSGHLVSTIALPGAATSGVAANKNGTVLVVSEATDGGLGHVQRRNPVSGTVVASDQLIGVAAPEIGGLVSSGVWIAEATGMLGFVERLSLAAMSPDQATVVEGSNGIGVTVANGLAWVTEGVNPRHDYCADPVTGRVLARVPLPQPLTDSVLAVSARYVYYESPAGHGFYLNRITVPGACR